MNPLLDQHALPRFDTIKPEHVLPALEHAIADHEAAVKAITDRRPTSFEEAWLPLERAETAIDAIWSTVSHLQAVADTPDLRAAFAEGQQKLVTNHVKVGQNRELYEVLLAMSQTPAFAERPDADRVAVQHALRGFVLSGVALEHDARDRFAAIMVELSDLSTAFSNAVLDATDAWSEHVTDEAVLRGIPDAMKEMFAEAARAQSKQGWLVTLQVPSVVAVLDFAEDRGLRERVYAAYGTRASDQGPTAGTFDNSARIARILALRQEAAELLGFANPVAQSLHTKMASSPEEVLGFLRNLAARAKPAAERDIAALRDFARDTLGIDDLKSWDVGFASNRLREARYAVDEEEVRGYFPVERVLEGWRTLLARLFGITLIARDDVPTYHPDAHYFDVADESGEIFSGLYIDLHARPGKRSGAWMAEARARLHEGNIRQNPVAYLTANFAPAGADTPSLLSHDDIVTLLHETGHVLHHLFTRVDRPAVAGTNGFEWDAVELPSQLMEDFAWDHAILTGMSGHHETGEALPEDLFARMLAARRFQAGMKLVRQLEFGVFDLLLHLGTLGSDPMVVIEAVRDEVAVVRPPHWHRFPHAFSHIFAGGYAAGYYGYLWAEVLSADGFQRFVEAGLVSRATGNLLRTEVLSRGATRPAADSFRAFRGRDADPAAMLKRHGLVKAVPAAA